MNRRTGSGDSSPNVLLVGANPRDARVVSCGLRREDASLDVARDVRGAIDQLTVASEDGTEAELPPLVILDLDTDSEVGLTVLTAIRASPRLRALPTIVLVDHTAPNCVRKAYQRGVNGHISKHGDIEAFADAIQQMAAFWFNRASLPPESLYDDTASIQYD